MSRTLILGAVFVVGSVALVSPTHTPIRDKVGETSTNETARDQLLQPVRHQGAARQRTSLDTTRFEFVTIAGDTLKHVAATKIDRHPGVATQDLRSGGPATLPASATPPVLTSTRMMVPTPPATVATIRALQRELKRLGCYRGQIDGDWGPTSRNAAATFIKAANARLSIEKPDDALLALARYHQGTACTHASSSIITASTTPITRAAVTTDALPDRTSALTTSSSVSSYAPRLASPPRIVRPNGASRVIDLTNSPEMPLPPPGEMEQRTQMALGAKPSSPRSTPKPVTRDRTSQQDRASAHRSAARNRQSQSRKRQAARNNWKRQVYQSINLSGI